MIDGPDPAFAASPSSPCGLQFGVGRECHYCGSSGWNPHAPEGENLPCPECAVVTDWHVNDLNAPYACHVLAARFEAAWGEWSYAIVMSPPEKAWTHWRVLPAPPALAAGTQRAETSETSARAEGCQSGPNGATPK